MSVKFFFGGFLLKLIISTLFMFFINAVSAETTSDRVLPHYLNEVREKSRVPAMAVAVITAGELSYIEGFGYLDEKLTTPVTDKVLFRAASISKLFTAQAIMKLVELKKLSLNDEVGL